MNMFPPAKQYVSGTGNAPEKKPSSVAQTCNQLSLFLKENGRLKDLRFGINSKFDDSVKSPTTKTIDLLTNMENLSRDTYNDKPIAASKSKTKQMTIFYNGQVVVVDDISEDRAKEVMLAATYSASAASKARGETTCSSSEHLGPNRRIDAQLQANGLDLPIARRASLHKFLAKRKDRANVRPEPYQLHNPSTSSYKNEHKFDLNL